MNKTRFIILGTARSGTTFIHKVLEEQESISMNKEEVNPKAFFKGIEQFTRGRGRRHTENELLKKNIALFDILTEYDKRNSTHLGLKIATISVDEAELIRDSFRSVNYYKLILIDRTDKLAQYISWIRGKKHNTWHKWDASQNQTQKSSNTLEINKREFIRYIYKTKVIESFFNSLKDNFPKKVLSLNYEQDILANNELAFEKLSKFLNVNIDTASANKYRKLSNADYENIKNYQWASEISRKLQNWHSSKIKQKYNIGGKRCFLKRLFRYGE